MKATPQALLDNILIDWYKTEPQVSLRLLAFKWTQLALISRNAFTYQYNAELK